MSTYIRLDTEGVGYGNYSYVIERSCFIFQRFDLQVLTGNKLYPFPNGYRYYNSENINEIPIYYDTEKVLDGYFDARKYISLYQDKGHSSINLVSKDWPWSHELSGEIFFIEDYMEVATNLHTFVFELSKYEKHEEACIVVLDNETFVLSNVGELFGSILGSSFVFKKEKGEFKLHSEYHIMNHGYYIP